MIATEKDLVPYEKSPLPEGGWLVLAPHPDDESIGMGGTLVLGTQKRIKIKLIWVTNGEKGGEPSQRRQESLQVSKKLNLNDVEFWNLPDRAVNLHLNLLAKKLQKLPLERFKTIFIPSFIEFHPDHRAVSLGVLAFLKEISWPGEIWLYEITRQGEINRLIVIDQVIEQKKVLLKCYQSQLRQIPYQEIALSLNKLRSYSLSHMGCRFAEGFLAGKIHDLFDIWKNLLKTYFLI